MMIKYSRTVPIKKRWMHVLRRGFAVFAIALLIAGVGTGFMGSVMPGVSQVYAAAPGDACYNGKCIIEDYLNPLIVTLSALVGVAVAASYIYAGIQYGSSANSPQKVSEAKNRITKTTFVIAGYLVFLAFLNWIVPGGLRAL